MEAQKFGREHRIFLLDAWQDATEDLEMYSRDLRTAETEPFEDTAEADLAEAEVNRWIAWKKLEAIKQALADNYNIRL